MNIWFVTKRVVACLLATSIMLSMMLVLSILLLMLALLRRMLRFKKTQYAIMKAVEQVAFWWSMFNHGVLRYLTPMKWHISGLEAIDPHKNYLLLANHQSWIDIPVIEEALYRRTGFSRYFVKKELLRVPIVGWICYALGFPAMHRFSKSQLAKNPHLRGKDTIITRQACERLRHWHFKLNNFAEGTRFTAEKQRRQQSPYRYLLKPKAGGVAFALHSLHDQLAGIINLTITYVGQPKSLWGVYFKGVSDIHVTIECLAISPDLVGDYEQDRDFRIHFQNWLNELWQHKDQTMALIYEKYARTHTQ